MNKKREKLHKVPLILMGIGNIGGTLLQQILDTREILAERSGIKLEIVALADISGVVVDNAGLPDNALNAALAASQARGVLASRLPVEPLESISSAVQKGAILADLTASPNTGALLEKALDSGCGAVLANKIPLAGAWEEAFKLLSQPFLRYEATVGAGLPVIDTLQYLVNTGDTFTLIEGCLSGTLGFLCSELEKGLLYSEVVANARAAGYTEPDPRDDLSGKDVARKALILARTAGWRLEESDLTIEALYPALLADMDVESFMQQVNVLDAEFAKRIQSAEAQGKVLRYVAHVTSDGGTVGLRAVSREGALGALRGPDNYVAFHTQRYCTIPLGLSGPGAGPAVTAAGVLGDIIKLAKSMEITLVK
jgi:homoserine dehydrogenase